MDENNQEQQLFENYNGIPFNSEKGVSTLHSEEQDIDDFYTEHEALKTVSSSAFKEQEIDDNFIKKQIEFYAQNGGHANQGKSSSCVFHAFCNAILREFVENNRTIRFSAAPYAKRVNFPGNGSIPLTEAKRLINGENPLFAYNLAKSDGMNEIFYDTFRNHDVVPTIGKQMFQRGVADYIKFFKLEDLSFENLKNKAQLGTLTFLIRGYNNSYWGNFEPKTGGSGSRFGHMVCAIACGTRNGKKGILIIDSAFNEATENAGFRFLTEEYLNENLEMCIMWKHIKPITKKVEDFFWFGSFRKCKIGDRNDYVKKLQEYLVSEVNYDQRLLTGYYGNYTSKKVLEWQLKHNITDKGDLKRWGGKYFGEMSIEQLEFLLNKKK